MAILIKNIKELIGTEDHIRSMVRGKEMATLNTISDAYLLLEDGFISDFGSMNDMSRNINASQLNLYDIIDASGRFVFPSFCDPHTHIVYAGNREQEFADRIRGLSYEEIARRGGGILNSANLLHDTEEEELYEQ